MLSSCAVSLLGEGLVPEPEDQMEEAEHGAEEGKAGAVRGDAARLRRLGGRQGPRGGHSGRRALSSWWDSAATCFLQMCLPDGRYKQFCACLVQARLKSLSLRELQLGPPKCRDPIVPGAHRQASCKAGAMVVARRVCDLVCC